MKNSEDLIHKFYEEYIDVNGIKEYTYHVVNEGKPVVLFVHGSGTPDSLFAYLQSEAYKDFCTCVYYDQRGAGKTYNANKKIVPHHKDMIEDLYETVLYIKNKYKVENVILVANSLGTLISAPFVYEHPELVSKYIVSGFITNMRQNEIVIKNILREKINLNENETQKNKDLKSLDSLCDYPYKSFDKTNTKAMNKLRKLQSKYGMGNTVTKEMKQMLFKSPIYHNSDLIAMIKSMKTNKALFNEIWNYEVRDYGKQLNVPIYFLHGDSDFVAPLSLAKDYFDFIESPHKEFITIKKAGHMTGFDNINDYNFNFKRICSTSI